MRKFSYSRASSDSECERKLYLSKEWGGTGLHSVKEGWSLVFGNILHKGLEEFAKSGQCDLKSVRQTVKEQGKLSGFDDTTCRDWAALAEGLLLGTFKCVFPLLLAEYDIIGTEKWIEWEPEPGFLFRCRQDLLLKSKYDGHICYLDWKTTSSTKPQWIKSWNKSVQLHSSMMAAREGDNIPVERAIVIGLSKGYEDRKTGVRRSPFTYGYADRMYPMSPVYSVEYQRGKQWEMFSTADEFEDLRQWVQDMPVPLLTEQFPQTPPIFYREDMARKWMRQQLIREHEIADALQLLESSTSIDDIERTLDKYFRQDFNHCEPAYGYDCAFKNLCWIPNIEADPLASGEFIRLEPEQAEGE